MKLPTRGGWPAKPSRIFNARLRTRIRHFISGIRGSTLRAADCGFGTAAPTLISLYQKPARHKRPFSISHLVILIRGVRRGYVLSSTLFADLHAGDHCNFSQSQPVLVVNGQAAIAVFDCSAMSHEIHRFCRQPRSRDYLPCRTIVRARSKVLSRRPLAYSLAPRLKPLLPAHPAR